MVKLGFIQVNEISFHERIRQELSCYPVKSIQKDGSVTISTIENSYFLENDVWDVKIVGEIPQFREHLSNYSNRNRYVYFEVESPSINLEIKYVWYHRLFREQWKLVSAFTHNSTHLRKLSTFLNEKYPTLTSLLDLDLEKGEREWTLWLERNGMETKKEKYYRVDDRSYTCKTKIALFFRSIHSSLFLLTDNREEWDKDRWDVRNLHDKYGIAYNKSKTNYNMDFNRIEILCIREQVKKYMKQRLLSKNNFSWSSAISFLFFLQTFISFIFKIEPTWNDLKALKRSHILQYIEWLHEYTQNNPKRKNAHPENYISMALFYVQKFLQDIQWYEYNIAPVTPFNMLIFPEDKPKHKKRSVDQIDYIPDYVLEQLFTHIEHLPKNVQPVLWVAFKTGLRISDVLGLTQNCIIKLNGKYYIETDIEKTYVEGHRIPIDEQLADILAVLIEKSIQNSNNDNNPEKYIFVQYSGSRKGKPFMQKWIQDQLNFLAREKMIKDENGQLFHFKTHQFRHTFAVKILNGGVDIFTVQELLAHASPEMTVRYAKLLDNTKRKAFEEAIKKGVFSFDLNGKVLEIKPNEDIPSDILETLWQDHKLSAIDNPYGTCHARINGNCPYAEEPPCLTCNGGSPCKDLAIGFSELDTQNMNS